jgi:PDDEXK-like domain of unknown function (DUF3799)
MQVSRWNGRPITRPGWYSGVPIERYHSAGICAGKAVSSSDLRTCWSKSPAHMFAAWCENPKAEERIPTHAMLVGATAHHLLLGEDSFQSKFIPHPLTYRDRVTAAEKPWHNGAGPCKAWVEKQQNAGRTVVTQAILESIVAMSRTLARLPIVQHGELLRGLVEISGFFKHEETGLWVKVRPDVVPTDSGIFVDLKTANDITTPAVQSSIRSLGYHQQGALIWQATDSLSPVEQFEFVLMFVETAAPYCARTVPIAREDIERGYVQNRAMLRKIADCILTDRWPGPGEDDDKPLPLSFDERARIDARLKFEGLT